MEALTFNTASGSKYIIKSGTLTRLSEVPMHDGAGKNSPDMLYREPMTNMGPLYVGEPFRCTVAGKPLTTTNVTSYGFETINEEG